MKFVKIATEGAILTPISKIPWTCLNENLASARTKVVLTAVNVIRFNERYKIAIFSATLPLSPMGNELLVWCLIDRSEMRSYRTHFIIFLLFWLGKIMFCLHKSCSMRVQRKIMASWKNHLPLLWRETVCYGVGQ